MDAAYVNGFYVGHLLALPTRISRWQTIANMTEMSDGAQTKIHRRQRVRGPPLRLLTGSRMQFLTQIASCRFPLYGPTPRYTNIYKLCTYRLRRK